jgi:hypothetical protein
MKLWSSRKLVIPGGWTNKIFGVIFWGLDVYHHSQYCPPDRKIVGTTGTRKRVTRGAAVAAEFNGKSAVDEVYDIYPRRR